MACLEKTHRVSDLCGSVAVGSTPCTSVLLSFMRAQISLREGTSLALANGANNNVVATGAAFYRRELEMHMRTYRDYVTVASNGDGAMILEAGFDLVRLPVPIGDLAAPVNGRPMPTDKLSEAVIRWNRVKGGSSYVVEYRPEYAHGPRPLMDGTE